MTDYSVESGAAVKLGRIEGELKVGPNVTIMAESDQRVVVTGGAYFSGSVTIECDFECESMKVSGQGYGSGGNVEVKGNLTVHKSADVAASLKVAGDFKADNVDVGGHLEAKSLVSKLTRIGGHMKIDGGLEAEKVDVGGHMSVLGIVKLGDLYVGGHAELGGGAIVGRIELRGHLSSTSRLEFGELESFGHIRLPGGSTGRKIQVLGKVEFLGDAICKDMQIKGVAKVFGDYSGEDVEVSGKFEVLGSMSITKKVEIYGVADVGKEVNCESLTVCGKLRADSILADVDAEVGGKVETSRGLKAKSILVRKGACVEGPLVGQQVEIGKMSSAMSSWGGSLWPSTGRTSVEDVYGNKVRIGRCSRARLVFAEDAEMDEESFAEKVTYTNDLKLPASYRLGTPPLKTSMLPEPPI
jgi:cytoskeletal protein CcmA (bactofilin family)